MQATAARLRQTFPDEAVARFVAQLFTAVAVFDTGGLGPTTGGTWLDGLVGGRVHSGTPPAVRRLLRADSIARGGDYQGALAVSASLAVDSAAQHEDPFLRTALFLRRAQWSARINDLDLARRTLYWHQHSSLQGWPTGDPEANDVDWAFGTVAGLLMSLEMKVLRIPVAPVTASLACTWGSMKVFSSWAMTDFLSPSRNRMSLLMSSRYCSLEIRIPHGAVHCLIG